MCNSILDWSKYLILSREGNKKNRGVYTDAKNINEILFGQVYERIIHKYIILQ